MMPWVELVWLLNITPALAHHFLSAETFHLTFLGLYLRKTLINLITMPFVLWLADKVHQPPKSRRQTVVTAAELLLLDPGLHHVFHHLPPSSLKCVCACAWISVWSGFTYMVCGYVYVSSPPCVQWERASIYTSRSLSWSYAGQGVFWFQHLELAQLLRITWAQSRCFWCQIIFAYLLHFMWWSSVGGGDCWTLPETFLWTYPDQWAQ